MHTRGGGAERTIYEVSKRLFERGHDVFWLSTKTQDLPSYQEAEGVKIYRLGGEISSHFKNLMFERRETEEVAIIDDLAHVVPWLSERFTSHPGTAFFRHLHRRTLGGQLPLLKSTILKTIESSYSSLYRRWPFVTESKQGMQDLHQLGIPKDRIVQIQPGVEHKTVVPKDKYDDPSLVYFGGMRDYKRPYEALHLMARIRETYPEAKLRVSGTGPSLKTMESITKSIGLENNVEFLGRLDRSSLFDVVSKSWLNLHFSVAEGWGLSIIEAAACGTPTLAYDVPGVAETVENGKNGIKVPEMDRDSLLYSALDILSNYDKWQWSSVQIAKKYSWETTTNMWENHLVNLAKQ